MILNNILETKEYFVGFGLFPKYFQEQQSFKTGICQVIFKSIKTALCRITVGMNVPSNTKYCILLYKV